MELNDFTDKEQKQINAGLSTAEISDKEAADKILALVPQEWIKKIPFFVRKHATTKTITILYERCRDFHCTNDIDETRNKRTIQPACFGFFQQLKPVMQSCYDMCCWVRRL